MVLTTDIIAMISPEGERVQLSKGLKARGNVEDWLGKVEESMFLSLRRCMKVSILHFSINTNNITCVQVSINEYMQKSRTEWVVGHANQIILTVSQIMWARGVHEILDGVGNVLKKMEQYEQKCIKV